MAAENVVIIVPSEENGSKTTWHMSTPSTFHFRTIVNGFRFLKEGSFLEFMKEFRKRIWSRSFSLGLRRDLENNFINPDANIDISLRPVRNGDFKSFKADIHQDRKIPKTLMDRGHLLQEDIPTCYVAVTGDGVPCYMQWLISSDENDRIQDIFRGAFPVLQKSEALLEAAYMKPSFRGLRIMPAAMARIAERAAQFGARYVVTFVDVENIPSLIGCRRSGFSPYILRKDSWFLFRRVVTYSNIPPDILDQYRQATKRVTTTQADSTDQNQDSAVPNQDTGENLRLPLNLK